MARTFALVLLVALAAPSRANDYLLVAGGHPILMDRHPKVRLVRTTVSLTVHARTVDGDATFVLRNDGPACNVRVGFPDLTPSAYDVRDWPKKAGFLRYRSFVGGRPARTRLAPGDAPGKLWHVKSVALPGHGTATLREVYRTNVGAVSTRMVMGTAEFFASAGAAWNSPIDRATITVRFAPDSELSLPLRVETGPKRIPDVHVFESHLRTPGGVVAKGPCPPVVAGRTLTFVRTNWTPTTDDDLYLYFLFPPKALAKAQAEERRKGGG